MSEIKSCPRVECGGGGVLEHEALTHALSRYPYVYHVKCEMCLMCGPLCSNEGSAIKEWNALPRPTKQEEHPERSQEQVEPVVNACPMCQEYPESYVTREPSDRKYVWLACACGVEGAFGESKQEAIEYWNMLSSEGDRWIRVKDELPAMTLKHLVLCSDGSQIVAMRDSLYSCGQPWFWRTGQAGDPIDDQLHKEVTHWQPLPSLPKPVKPDSTSGWISVEDRLPELRLHVMVYAKGWIGIAGRQETEPRSPEVVWTSNMGGSRIPVTITHWRPLPSGPDDRG